MLLKMIKKNKKKTFAQLEKEPGVPVLPPLKLYKGVSL